MEKCFRVNFKAQLNKFTLAFRGDSSIDIFWKKGQKIAQTLKVPLINACATINQSLQISCNMMFNSKTKSFQPKITKFQIILITDRGNKKVGEIHFDVAPYLNERNKQPKYYQLSLEKCPDTNARLTLELSASIEQEISPDTISNSSAQTVNVETLVGPPNSQSSSSIPAVSSSSLIPTRDNLPSSNKLQEKPQNIAVSRVQNQGEGGEKVNQLISQNRKIQEQLKAKERYVKENEQLRRKIKAEEYASVNELKEKIENGRKEMQKLQATIKKQVLLEKEVKSIEEEIFKCKYQIMSAFNYANERGGGKLLYEMQEACGLKEL